MNLQICIVNSYVYEGMCICVYVCMTGCQFTIPKGSIGTPLKVQVYMDFSKISGEIVLLLLLFEVSLKGFCFREVGPQESF